MGASSGRERRRDRDDFTAVRLFDNSISRYLSRRLDIHPYQFVNVVTEG